MTTMQAEVKERVEAVDGGNTRAWNNIHHKQGMARKNVGSKKLSMNVTAITPDIPFAEYTVSESPLRRELVHVATDLKDGVATIPQAPGLGVELNEEIVAKYRMDR